jgi:hypothetical protein
MVGGKQAGRTLAVIAWIKIEGQNNWITITQNATKPIRLRVHTPL